MLGSIYNGLVYVAKHKGTHAVAFGGIVAGAIVAAQAAGVDIDNRWLVAGPLLAELFYRVMPYGIQAKVDEVTDRVDGIAGDMPQTYPADVAEKDKFQPASGG